MTVRSRPSPARWLPRAALSLLAALWLIGLVPAAGAAKTAAAKPSAAKSRPGHRAQGATRVPQGFVGTVLGDPVFPAMATTPELGAQLDSMVASGVESMRVVFDWSVAQPYKSWSQVPQDQAQNFTSDGIDNVPTNWTQLDDLVAAAATRHLSLLPVVIGAPSWDGKHYRNASVSIPRRDSGFAAFCAALAHRYGRNGTFWQAFSPIVPITTWQIWNEPNLYGFWPVQPFAASYVRLLKVARAAIRRQDPRAQIVLAGLANYSWTALRSIYKVPGARRLFDIVGLHPYTRTPQGVVTILQLGREVMTAYGDSTKPIVADEISWPSSQGKTVHTTGYDFATTEKGQARNVGAVIPLLAADRAKLRLKAVYYYTWATVEMPHGLAFTYAGLLKYAHHEFLRKPVFYTFKSAALAAERCRTKGPVATVCAQAASG